jgi:hypothetical protein
VVVVLVVSGIAGKKASTTAGPTSSATYSSAPTIRPSASKGAGSVKIKPTEKAEPGTQKVPGATPAATPDPGTASGFAQKPTSLQSDGELTSEVSVSLSSMKAVEGKAGGAGEVSGPALLFTVTIDNRSAKALNLSSTVVTVTYSSKLTPSSEFVSKRKGFPTVVKAGAKATATYTFAVPLSQRSDVRVTVDYGVSVPSVVFEGAVAK